MTAALLWRWDGKSAVPLTNRPVDLEPGTYRFDVVDERSRASHAHYFARIAELWANLPERLSGETWAMTPEFLRHYALIREGYCHATPYACASLAEARRWHEMLPKPVSDRGEPIYFERAVNGSVLVEVVPETQKMLGNGGMGKERFYASKDAVLGFLENLIGAKAEDTAA